MRFSDGTISSLVYVSINTIPSLTADSIHTMKMCQAMVQEGMQTELVWPSANPRNNLVDAELWRHYGITSEFSLAPLRIPKLFNRHLFPLMAAIHARRCKPSVVYSRSLPAAMWATMMGVPTIWEHMDPLSTKAQFMYLKILARSQKFLGIVTISDPLKQYFDSRFARTIDSDKIVVAQNGVDPERFENLPGPSRARATLGLDEHRFTVGYMGHLYKGRGVELIQEMATRMPTVQFLMVGGQSAHVEFRTSEARRLGITNMDYKGFVPNVELPKYMAACEVLLMPYQREVSVSSGGSDTSGWMSPMKMFEYMATRRLIISSDHAVLREVLSEQNALLCDPEDVDAWETGIRKAASDVGWRERLADRAYQDVKQYTWRNRVKRIFQALGLNTN